jgi:hypothetical protein
MLLNPVGWWDWLANTTGTLRCVLVAFTVSTFWLMLTGFLWSFLKPIGIDASSMINYILLMSAFAANHIVYCLFHKMPVTSLGVLRSSLAALGFQKWRYALPYIGIGIVIGASANFVFVFAQILLGTVTFSGFSWFRRDSADLLTAVTRAVFGFLSTAAWEETVFRGFSLQATESTRNRFYWIAATSSVIFALRHDFATEYGVAPVLGYFAGFLGGMMFSQAARLRNALWLPFGLHWIWDICSALLKGTGTQIGDPSLLIMLPVPQYQDFRFR